MKVAIGCDHGGLLLKEGIVAVLENLGHQIEDVGTFTNDSVDYPQFAKTVCAKVQDGSCQRGILICGTGIGMSMVANRFEDIRAALCHELFTARMSREHNDANVLCLGARVIGPGLADEIVRTWMTTDFAGGRHLKRIEMF
ncbi:MAG: ribose 5-phosphate isomerase B [Thermodesulfobacteriota bacterium]